MFILQANLEKIMTARGGQFFAGNKFSWAELHFYQLVDRITDFNAKVLQNYPKLRDNVERTKNLPNIKKWLQTRPKTEM